MLKKRLIWKRRLFIIWNISFIKTIFINFKMLPVKQAIKLPILIGKGVKIRNYGKIKINNSRLKFNTVSFGIFHIFNSCHNKCSIIDNEGTLIFNGTAIFQSGISIKTFKNGIIEFGNRYSLGVDSLIVAKTRITFGDCVRTSWSVQIFDTDFHYLENIITNMIKINTLPIHIGNNCWICNNVTISKGVKIGNNTTIASNSVANKSFDAYENIVIGGIPAIILKKDIKQIFDHKEEMLLESVFSNKNIKITKIKI